jgi:hypothetical protein
MDVRLTTVSGAKPVTIALRLPTVIGRGDEAKIRLRQSQVSRKHCAIYEENQQLLVRDLGSSNGTFLNGRKIARICELSPGDQLKVGLVTFQLDFEPVAIPAKVIAEDAATDSNEVLSIPSFESSAVLRYREMSGGSFIGIDTGQAPVEAVDSFPTLEGVEALSYVDDDVRLDLGKEERPPAVDQDESALDRFLRSLD